MDKKTEMIAGLPLADLHQLIVSPHPQELHGNIEDACMLRIARIERLPLGPDGRWWHYPNAHAFPYGN